MISTRDATVQAAIISGAFLLGIGLMEAMSSCASQRASRAAFVAELQRERFRDQAETLRKFAMLSDRVRTDSYDLLATYLRRFQQTTSDGERAELLANQLIASRNAIDGPDGAGKDVAYSLKLYFPRQTPGEWRDQLQAWGKDYIAFVNQVHACCVAEGDPQADKELHAMRLRILNSMWQVEDECHEIARKTLSEWQDSED